MISFFWDGPFDHQNTSSLNILFLSVSFLLYASPDEVITSHGAIEADKDNVRQEPYSLPQGFMWDTLDLGNADVVSDARVSATAALAHIASGGGGCEHHRQDTRLLL